MDSYNGIASTQLAYRLIPCLMLRPGELVSLRWENIDFEAALIRIDGDGMKKDLSHLVPMATQVIDLMRLLQAFSGDGEYLFPNRQGKHHLHRDTLSKGLRSLGYAGKHPTALEARQAPICRRRNTIATLLKSNSHTPRATR